MSPSRQPKELTAEQEPFLTARSLATTYGSGYVIEPHIHGWHQLLHACSGAMTVFGERMSWMIPPGRAVFIPAGNRHWIRMWGHVAMRSLYFPTSVRMSDSDLKDCRVISVTPLLRELILRVVELSALDSRIVGEMQLMTVLVNEMGGARVEPLALPLPADRRALAAARSVLEDIDRTTAIDELAYQCGASARTLERVFRKETGMRFSMWRQKARMLESVRVLVEGESVTNAALECGYSSVSAYIAAFKQTFGYTPGALLADRDPILGDSE
ncbi:MAG TPA: helix-turn-helix transcriptional regulator [Candidatus Acidoferrales bacterium]|jgi:AraC-like DNA-binding protein|nr:helix-turn-helix transcriptional regulator [Candidatus Acidoferrales bacterium]